MKYAIVTVPAAPVRKRPNHRQEMSNELFFGEAVEIIKKKNDTWIKIKSLYDGYIGWVTYHLITQVSAKDVNEASHFLAPHLLTSITINGQSMHLPQGATLLNFKNNKGSICGLEYKLNVNPIDLKSIHQTAEQLLLNAQSWLSAPYLWGGKTILGVDCSGFCQIMYKLIGLPIARDASEQAKQGKLVKQLTNAKPGDLAFFNDKDEIVHVGILLGTDKIIHASGKVRIDTIDKEGIIHLDTKKRTHRLKLIKRFL